MIQTFKGVMTLKNHSKVIQKVTTLKPYMISYNCSIVIISLFGIINMVQSFKCVISDLDLERSSQGHPKGHQLEADIWFPISVQ